MRFRMLATSTALAVVLTAGVAHADPTIYSNNFDTNSTTGFTGSNGYTPTIVAAPNGSTSFLGDLSTSQTTANLSLNTAGYSSITLSYTLDSVLSQDGIGPQGNNSASNPDSFTVTQNGVKLSDYSFANYGGGNQQSYCPGTVGPCAPQTGAATVGALGYTQTEPAGFGDAEYTFSYTFATTGPTTVISFTSNDNEGVGNEFYGIDNVLVTGTPITGSVSAAPEPGAWALLLGGVGLLGVMLRAARGRRREDAPKGIATA